MSVVKSGVIFPIYFCNMEFFVCEGNIMLCYLLDCCMSSLSIGGDYLRGIDVMFFSF